MAYWYDDDNSLAVLINREKRAWGFRLSEAGTISTGTHPLPADFNYDAYHQLCVMKNGRVFEVILDDRPAPGSALIETAFTGNGRVGLFTDTAPAAFDGVTYTMGWDEVDAGIRGWGRGASGTASSGQWKIDDQGLHQEEPRGESRIFKGDLLRSYDFTTQVTFRLAAARAESSRCAGIYALYVNDTTWLRADIDPERHQLHLTGRKAGKPQGPWAKLLKPASSYNLRTVKLSRRTIFYVDGRQVMEIPGSWPPSQVGLVTSACQAVFNGITAFRLE